MKIERAFVFTANNFYLCSDINDETNGFTIETALPIVGNEDLINEIREKSRNNIVPIDGTSERLNRLAEDMRSRGGRNSWNDTSDKGQRGGTRGTIPVSLRQSSDTTGDNQLSGNDGETEKTDGDSRCRIWGAEKERQKIREEINLIKSIL